jgi:hypothetical protein
MERYYIYIPQKVNDKLKPARAAHVLRAQAQAFPRMYSYARRALDHLTLIGTSAQGFAPSCGSRLSFG